MLGLSLYVIVDTYFIARELGANGLASLNLAIPIYSFIYGGGLMLGIGGATKYAILKSQNKHEDANRIYTNTIILSVCISVAFFIAGLFFSSAITGLLGADEVIFDMTHIYLRVILLSGPLFILKSVLTFFIRNDGAPGLAMAALFSGSIANIIFDYIFIVMLQMGMFGAALATALAGAISLVIVAYYFVRKRNNFRLINCGISLKIVGGVFSIGLPTFASEVSAGVIIVVFNLLILGLQGNIGVAAYGVIANVSIVILSIYNGIAQGIQPLISQYYGKGEKDKVKIVLRYALLLMAALSVTFYVYAFFGANQIAGIFNSENNPILQSVAITGIRIYFIACLFVGFNIIISVYFTSADYARPAHIISMLRGFLIIIPMAFLLSAIGGMTGIWLVFPVTEIIVSLVGLALYRVKKYQI